MEKKLAMFSEMGEKEIWKSVVEDIAMTDRGEKINFYIMESFKKI